MEGLPLYHCRIAIAYDGSGISNKTGDFGTAWLGIIGTITAFGVPDPSDLCGASNNITFICTHYLIAMSSLIISRNSKAKF